MIFTPYPPISILTYILFNIKYYSSLCGYISLMLTLLIFVKQLTRNSSTILWKNMRMELIKFLTRKQKTSNFIQTWKLHPLKMISLKQAPSFTPKGFTLNFFLDKLLLDIGKIQFLNCLSQNLNHNITVTFFFETHFSMSSSLNVSGSW